MLKIFRKDRGLNNLLALCQKFQEERDEARRIAEAQRKTILNLRLQLSMKPNPSLRQHRLASLQDPHRKARYLDNIAAMGADVSYYKGNANGYPKDGPHRG